MWRGSDRGVTASGILLGPCASTVMCLSPASEMLRAPTANHPGADRYGAFCRRDRSCAVSHRANDRDRARCVSRRLRHLQRTQDMSRLRRADSGAAVSACPARRPVRALSGPGGAPVERQIVDLLPICPAAGRLAGTCGSPGARTRRCESKPLGALVPARDVQLRWKRLALVVGIEHAVGQGNLLVRDLLVGNLLE
jgi:hypothetical protein